MQDPDNWQVHATLGITLDRLGQFEEAVARYRAALVRSPNNSAVHNNIALSLAQVGRLDEAISALEIVVESERSTAQTRQNLALLYALQGDLERAEKLAREDLPPALVKDRMETFLGLRQAPAAPPSSEKDERARAPAEGTPRQADAVGTSRPVALKAYVALRNADVRRDPSIRSRAFAVLQKDETVRVIETAKNRRWYRVRLDDGREGYIYSSLIAERK